MFKLRTFAVMLAMFGLLVPNLPTIASTLPGFESIILHAMYAPVGTPPAIVNQMSQEISRFLKTPEARAKILGLAVEPIGTTPSELDALVKADAARWAKVIKDANIHAD